MLETATNQSGIRLAIAARLSVNGRIAAPADIEHDGDTIGATFAVAVKAGVPVVVDKTVAVATGRDAAVASARLGALDALNRTTPSFAALLPAHEAAWRRIWDRFTVTVDADSGTQAAIDLHLFHLAQTLSPHTVGLDVGVPARGLHGEGYRGHVFWDELFVFPLLDPANARPHPLAAAVPVAAARRRPSLRPSRRAGRARCSRGRAAATAARKPPTSCTTPARAGGCPTTPRLQQHVGLAVAYNVWHHYQVTGDVEFLAEYGAELLVEIARLFAGLAAHDPADDRYDIAGVMGPDEYHDAYPDAAEPGLRNNAYTNVMAAWLLARALDAVALLDGASLRPAVGTPRARRRRARPLGAHEPAYAGPVPRRRGHQPVRRLRAPRRTRLGSPTGPRTATSAASTSSSKPKATPPTGTGSPNRPTCSCSSTCSCRRTSCGRFSSASTTSSHPT